MQKVQNRLAIVDNRNENKGVPGKRPSDFPWVTYNATRCPNCGSTNTHITRSERMTKTLVQRIHKCNGCKASFNSEQILEFVDQKQKKKPTEEPAKKPSKVKKSEEPKNSEG